jgi:hypothetical protein
MMKQSDAVVSAVTAVCGVRESYTWEQVRSHLPEVVAILTEGFMSGQIQLSDPTKRNHAWLKTYIPGLVNNHVRKDKRLNGGTVYQAKNPGSRQGSGDPQIKAMRALLATGQVTDPSDIAEVEAAIAARQAELAPRVEVDYSALPAALRAKFGK